MSVRDAFRYPFLALPLSARFSGSSKMESLNEYVVRPSTSHFSDRIVSVQLSNTQKAILRTLLYFGIFDYPLNAGEIKKFSSTELVEIEDDLQFLCHQNLVFQFQGFYFLSPVPEIVDQRKIRNSNAANYLPLAKKYSKWMFLVPFVKSISISGSLSKNDMGKNADIDYFVIVQADRVWIMRLIFSMLIKPLTLIGLRNKYLCPNYIIDENHLEIRDKNLYTAIEIATLIPVEGKLYYQRFLDANSWVNLILPNGVQSVDKQNDNSLKTEHSWLSPLLTVMDNAIFKLYKWHYKRKFYDSRKWKIEDFELKFNKFESKNHLNGYRNKILTKHDEGIARFEKSYGVSLT